MSIQIDDMIAAFMHTPIDSRAHEAIIGSILQYLKTLESRVTATETALKAFYDAQDQSAQADGNKDRRRVLHLLQSSPYPMQVRTIAKILGWETNATNQMLLRLAKDGIIQRVSQGVYTALPTAQPATIDGGKHYRDPDAELLDKATRLFRAARAVEGMVLSAEFEAALDAIEPILATLGGLEPKPEAPDFSDAYDGFGPMGPANADITQGVEPSIYDHSPTCDCPACQGDEPDPPPMGQCETCGAKLDMSQPHHYFGECDKCHEANR